MNCVQVEQAEVTERYLAGTLPEAELTAFEEHYFECDACLARLEAAQGLAAALREPQPARGGHRAALAIAASLLVAATGAVIWYGVPAGKEPRSEPVAAVEKPAPPPVNPLWAKLGHFEPPEYREIRLRGVERGDRTEFQQAMRTYQKGQFAEAMPALRKAVESNPRDVEMVFFAGVTSILAGDRPGGLDLLRRADSFGLTPYQEEARYYQAKTLLQMGDSSAARQVLEKLASMRGDWEMRARELLREIPQ